MLFSVSTPRSLMGVMQPLLFSWISTPLQIHSIKVRHLFYTLSPHANTCTALQFETMILRWIRIPLLDIPPMCLSALEFLMNDVSSILIESRVVQEGVLGEQAYEKENDEMHNCALYTYRARSQRAFGGALCVGGGVLLPAYVLFFHLLL